MKQNLLFFSAILLCVNILSAQDFSLQFDEANSQRLRYLTSSGDMLDTKLNGATDYTIELWVKPTSTDIHNKVLIKRWNQFAITLYKNDTKRFYFTHYSSGGNTYVNTVDNVINLDQWNHLVIICNSSTNSVKLYANGVDVTLAPQMALSLEASPASSNLYVGYGGSGTYFTGLIDKVRAKNTAESIGSLQSSITDADYTSDANTAILYNFNEGTGLVTQNEVDSENGTLQCNATDCSAGEAWWVDNSLSIAKSHIVDFNLYPNPVKDNMLFIETKNGESIQKFELFDIIGKAVLDHSFDKLTFQTSLNIDGLKSGVYLARIKTDFGVGVQKLVIK